jgi:hypothetical protein
MLIRSKTLNGSKRNGSGRNPNNNPNPITSVKESVGRRKITSVKESLGRQHSSMVKDSVGRRRLRRLKTSKITSVDDDETLTLTILRRSKNWSEVGILRRSNVLGLTSGRFHSTMVGVESLVRSKVFFRLDLKIEHSAQRRILLRRITGRLNVEDFVELPVGR